MAIQGVGHVGAILADKLAADGREAGDLRRQRGAGRARSRPAPAPRWSRPTRSSTPSADVFAPCALGGAISAATLPRLKARIVAGGANNQLADTAAGQALFDAGLTYAPDFVINGGGIINVAAEIRALEARRAPTTRPGWR